MSANDVLMIGSICPSERRVVDKTMPDFLTVRHMLGCPIKYSHLHIPQAKKVQQGPKGKLRVSTIVGYC